MDVHVDLREDRLGCAPPVVDGTEVRRLLGGMRGHLEGARSDQGLWLGPPIPRVSTDHLLVYQVAGRRDRGKRRQEPTCLGVELGDDGVVVGGGKAAHLEALVAGRQLLLDLGLEVLLGIGERLLLGVGGSGTQLLWLDAQGLGCLRHGVEAGDGAQVGGVWALQGCRPVPRVENVLGGDLVTVGERHVLAQGEGVGQSVARDPAVAGAGDVGGDVGLNREAVVKPQQAVEEVLPDLLVDFRVQHTGVEGPELTKDWELQGLVRGQVLTLAARAPTGDQQDARHGSQGQRPELERR